MTTNLDRAAFRARSRAHTFQFPPPRPERPSWMETQEDSGLVRLIVVGLAIALGVGLMFAFWARVASDVRDDEFTRNTVNECKAMGRYPHVDRDAAQKVVAVRCDAFEDGQ